MNIANAKHSLLRKASLELHDPISLGLSEGSRIVGILSLGSGKSSNCVCLKIVGQWGYSHWRVESALMPKTEKNHENSSEMGKGWKTMLKAFISQSLCSFFSQSSCAALNSLRGYLPQNSMVPLALGLLPTFLAIPSQYEGSHIVGEVSTVQSVICKSAKD